MKTKSDRMRAGWYKLDVWNPLLGVWSPIKGRHDSAGSAVQASGAKPGKYRITHFGDSGTTYHEPFNVFPETEGF